MQKKIYQKIGNIMKKIGAVEKAGKVEFGKVKYSYQKIEDIVTEVRQHMIDEGVVMFPISADLLNTVVQSVAENNGKKVKTVTTTILYKYKFVAIEDSSEIIVGMIGQGADTADKGSNKAASGAYKYILKEVFMIEAGEDDPDKTPSGQYSNYKSVKPTQASEKQKTFMKDLNKRKNVDLPAGFPAVTGEEAKKWIDKVIKYQPKGK